MNRPLTRGERAVVALAVIAGGLVGGLLPMPWRLALLLVVPIGIYINERSTYESRWYKEPKEKKK